MQLPPDPLANVDMDTVLRILCKIMSIKVPTAEERATRLQLQRIRNRRYRRINATKTDAQTA